MARTKGGESQDDARQRSLASICRRAQEEVVIDVGGNVLNEAIR